jgi:hypothetical protein
VIAAASSSILASEARAGDPPEIVISQHVQAIDGATSRVEAAWADTRLSEELEARLGERYAVSRSARCDENDSPCSLARARRRHADWLVRATLRAEAADHHVRLEVVRPQDGHTAAIVEETCEICGRAELDGFFASVVGTLMGRLQALSQPVEPIGTPAPVAPPERRSPALRIAGFTTLGVGAATAIPGAILWGLDGRPHRASCDVPDPEGRCPNIYSSRAGGIALTAVGVAALAVGATLLAIDHRVRSGSDRRARARVRWDGAGVTWTF